MILRIRFSLVLVVVGLVFASLSAQAVTGIKTEVLLGWCDNGNMWTTVIEIAKETGRVVRMRGIDCDGKYWEKKPASRIVISPPYETSDHLYQAEIGEGTWWVRMNMASDHKPRNIWGRDNDGAYWEVENIGGPNIF